jgi:hypothetical protein
MAAGDDWPMRALAILLTLAATVPTPALGHEIPVNTVQGLVQNCTLEDDDQTETEHHLGLCLGFIKGVTNALGVHNLLKACPPSGLENGDLMQAVLTPAQRLKQSDQAKMPSAMFVQVVLENAFPCR